MRLKLKNEYREILDGLVQHLEKAGFNHVKSMINTCSVDVGGEDIEMDLRGEIRFMIPLDCFEPKEDGNDVIPDK